MFGIENRSENQLNRTIARFLLGLSSTISYLTDTELANVIADAAKYEDDPRYDVARKIAADEMGKRLVKDVREI